MQYKNILVPMDFTIEDNTALRKAMEIKGDSNAKLTLVHVIDYSPPAYVKPELPEIFASETLMTERATLHLNKIIEEENVTDFELIVKVGRTKSELPDIITKQTADLVVMARHNHTGLDRLIGSTTDSVVRTSSCDVLVVNQS